MDSEGHHLVGNCGGLRLNARSFLNGRSSTDGENLDAVPVASERQHPLSPPGRSVAQDVTKAKLSNTQFSANSLQRHASRLDAVLSCTKKELESFIEMVSAAEASQCGFDSDGWMRIVSVDSDSGNPCVTTKSTITRTLDSLESCKSERPKDRAQLPGVIVDGVFVPEKSQGRQSFKGGLANLRKRLTHLAQDIEDAQLQGLLADVDGMCVSDVNPNEAGF